jgi:glycolate oxidase
MAEQVGEESINLMRAIKKALDPRGILNPGKMGL